MKKQAGLTLIEVIAALTLLSILAVAGTLGFVSAVRGVVLATDNNQQAQKAQVALTRLGVEFSRLWDVSSSSTTSITYSMENGTVDNLSRTCFTLSSLCEVNTITYTAGGGTATGTLRYNFNGAGLQTLLDGVHDFKLCYLASPTEVDTPCAATSFSTSTRIIAVTLTTRGQNNVQKVFKTRITPKFGTKSRPKEPTHAFRSFPPASARPKRHFAPLGHHGHHDTLRVVGHAHEHDFDHQSG